MTQRALVVSIGKNVAWVALDGETEPRLATLRRQTGKRTMLVPGDAVHVRVLEDGRSVVDTVEPRAFALQRRTREGRAKTIAANVDTIAPVTALARPAPRTVTLDQLLAFAELESIGSLVIFTKPDLSEPSERERLQSLYASLGYQTLVCDPKHGENVEVLRQGLAGRHALLCGVSGVGKSSIFGALGGAAAVGATSRHGLGRQTTSSARLYRFADGFLIDSPGVAEFGLGDIGPAELIEGFREMREPAERCRFRDCAHLHEPGCAVLTAVADGTIAASRHDSYRRILGREA